MPPQRDVEAPRAFSGNLDGDDEKFDKMTSTDHRRRPPPSRSMRMDLNPNRVKAAVTEIFVAG